MKFVLTTLLAIQMAIFSLQSNADLVELDRVVAIVNDEVISLSELNAEMKSVKVQLRQQSPTLPPDAVLQKQVVERLIMKHLKAQLASRNNILVDDDTLNKAINNIAKQNNLSIARLRDVLIKDGLDFNAYRENIRHEILHTRLRQRYVDNRISITDIEVDQFLQQQQKRGTSQDEYRLGHILISLPEGASAKDIQAAKQEGQKILDKLNQGEAFSQLAIAHSDGQLALDGGDLGWRKLGELPSLFANVATNMKKGDISQLIRSPSGFHIIQLTDQRGGERHVVTQTHARHILIKTNALVTDSKAKQHLLELKHRIENGDDFGKLARAHSDDKASAAKGGDLGWSNPGQMVPAFEKVMDESKPGVVSEPFQSRFGWHILEVLGKRQHDDTEQFKRNSARQQLFERKIAEEEELWMRRLRDEAYVELRL